MDASRTLEGLNLVTGNVNLSLTTAAVTVTVGNAIGASGIGALLDGHYIPNTISAAAKTPVYVAPDGVSLIGTTALPTAPVLIPYAGATQNGQSNVGAYGQAAIVVFGVQLQRVAGQPLSLQQIFNPSGAQVDNSGNALTASSITAPLISGTGGAGAFSATSGQALVVGQQVQITGTNTGTGTITGYASGNTYRISATNGTTTFTLVDLQGAAIATSATNAGTFTGLTFQVINTWASLIPAISAIVGPVTNVDKSGVMQMPNNLVFPAIPDNFIPFAYSTIYNPYNSGATFTFGTSNWNATGIQAVTFNCGTLPKRSKRLLA
jgi:hypothetical protein